MVGAGQKKRTRTKKKRKQDRTSKHVGQKKQHRTNQKTELGTKKNAWRQNENPLRQTHFSPPPPNPLSLCECMFFLSQSKHSLPLLVSSLDKAKNPGHTQGIRQIVANKKAKGIVASPTRVRPGNVGGWGVVGVWVGVPNSVFHIVPTVCFFFVPTAFFHFVPRMLLILSRFRFFCPGAFFCPIATLWCSSIVHIICSPDVFSRNQNPSTHGALFPTRPTPQKMG